MHETYTWEDLLAVLQQANPIKAGVLHRSRRRSENGLLSVGIKLHCLSPEYIELQKLVRAVGGFAQRPYMRTHASLTYVLPPVGSAKLAVMLIECIEDFTGYKIFDNRAVQIQVCSPCRLERQYAAILAVAFYLGSDVLRRYRLKDLETTFSGGDEPGMLIRGRRIVLYDGRGDLDRRFMWWDLEKDGLEVRNILPFKEERTDILTARSRVDIYNINLAMTLLAHHQQIAFWEDLGFRFVQDIENLLREHMLEHVLSASWVHDEEHKVPDDEPFYWALEELMTYAFEEYGRINKARRMFWRRAKQERPGILSQMREILQKYEREVGERSRRLFERGEGRW